MKHGMTLTSLLVAVALSGIIAVFGGRLVVNQMFMAATAELIDKGDSIMQFYLNALQDRETWRCTLFDEDNGTLRKYMFTRVDQGHIPTAGIAIPLRGPDCDHRQISTSGVSSWQSQEVIRTRFLTGNKRGTELIPVTGKKIGDSIMASSTAGWWQVNLKAIPAGGRGDIDLELSLCLNETDYLTAHQGHKQVPRSYRWKCEEDENKTRRIRYSETAISVGCSYTHTSASAIVSVTNRTAGAIDVSCSYGLLVIPENKPSAWKLAPQHQLNKQDIARQGVTPETCPGRRPIVYVGNGDVQCGSGALVSQLPMVCSTDTPGMDKVLCGFSQEGEKTCCTPKGPKGPKGLKGCTPTIVKNQNDKSSRVCKLSCSNTETCPAHGGDYILDDLSDCQC